jgi:ATP-dependent DNA ligase
VRSSTRQECRRELSVLDTSLCTHPVRGASSIASAELMRIPPFRFPIILSMPFQVRPPLTPMEALSVDAIPEGEEWQYEPKWDGFRCLSFRDGNKIELQSKSQQPLARYFPERVRAFSGLKARRFVLDGEIAVPEGASFSFDALLQRIHPAASRVERLSAETRLSISPSTFSPTTTGHHCSNCP